MFALAVVLAVLTFTATAVESKAKNPLLLISLGGLRADKLDQFLAKNRFSFLRTEFVDEGVKAEHMVPSFPSETFPNTFSLVTGLKPEKHGIVGDKYYDEYNKKLMLNLPNRYYKDQRYWNRAEPIWTTCSRQNVTTASSFWPAADAMGMESDIFLSYHSAYTFAERCQEVVNWYKKFSIDFGLLYLNEPYTTGINYGPDSIQYGQKLEEIDLNIGELLTQLKHANLLDSTNIVIVSDSGMTDFKKTIVLKNYLNESLMDSGKSTYGVVSNLYAKNPAQKAQIYESLKKISNMDVYYKHQIPASLGYGNNSNVGDIVAICHEGYSTAIVAKQPKGINGYYNTLESMRGVFLARGPDFKANVQLKPFSNVDVYSLLCKLVNVKCKPNEGTINSFVDALNYS